ncbi:MAG: hypothetical protein Q8S73_00400 [Deltaproteobacteria bacterium]|nr:hypothetical protein [Myxococcales bacterium]MDP3212532.1 hypothetical protein [Deltaproteobacteria bacterium]
MRDLNPDLQSLVDAARAADVPRPDDRERIRRGLAAQLGAAALLASTTATGSASAAGATSAVAVATVATTATSLSTKLAVVALIVAGGAGTAVLTRAANAPRAAAVTAHPAPADRPQVAPLPEAPIVRASVAPASVGTVPEALHPVAAPARVAPRAPRAHVGPGPGRPAPAWPLIEEVALLREAQRALQSGGTVRALDLIERHASRYPDGAMREERLALRVVALCDAGRRSEARAAADRFVREAPRSVFVARVRSSCAEADTDDSVTGADPSLH